MKPGKEANRLLELIVALKAEKHRLERAINLRRFILAGGTVHDLEWERSMSIQFEIKVDGV